MKKTRVSVVIPCYNEERWLGECLESLRNQTAAPHEIIVVDNNSSDKSAAIAERHGAIVVTESRQGIAYARNAGFDAAAGDVIARIDADSVADPEWVSSIITAMKEPGVVAVGGASYMHELRGVMPLARAVYRWFNVFHERRFHGLTVLYGFNYAIRKETWKELVKQLDSAAINEDIDVSISARQYGSIVRCREMVVGNRVLRALQPGKVWRYLKADAVLARRLK